MASLADGTHLFPRFLCCLPLLFREPERPAWCRLPHHQELELLEDDAVVYKMVGPLMVKQDLVEAKSNVGKRLEYIDGEMTRLDSQLASIEKKQVDRQKEVPSPTRTPPHSFPLNPPPPPPPLYLPAGSFHGVLTQSPRTPPDNRSRRSRSG